ncbi:hypothetical protein Dimus_033153 [Dionaea muscipula]
MPRGTHRAGYRGIGRGVHISYDHEDHTDSPLYPGFTPSPRVDSHIPTSSPFVASTRFEDLEISPHHTPTVPFGSSQPTPISSTCSALPELTFYGTRMFASDLSSVSHKIPDCIRSKFYHPYPTWKKMTVVARDLWFIEFRNKYRWDESIEGSVRVAFEKSRIEAETAGRSSSSRMEVDI